MRYKLTYVYSNSYKKFTQIFSSNLLLKVILKYVRKNLRVINIEISKHY
uniref:Putative site-specific serine recombinase-resolvase family protein n=1 Tax=Clostridium perfringens TaxID=1502 RepID=A0A0N7BVI1_CLOPF|nr:putative site-specific serine recombinase-resolvase family protein [Clostridium perfringens]